jgi:ribosomal protein L39E
MTQHTPLRNNRHHSQFRLQPGVLHLDTSRRVYYHRRRRTWRDLIWDLIFGAIIPLLILASVGILIWILIAIGRAARSLGGMG